MDFEIFGLFLFHGGTGPPHAVITYIPSNAPCHKEQKCICGLGVGISTVFEILGHFLFKGRPGPPCISLCFRPFPLHLKPNFSPPRMICIKSGFNWPGGSGEGVDNVKASIWTTGDQNFIQLSEFQVIMEITCNSLKLL
jgi:hypothetical protein